MSVSLLAMMCLHEAGVDMPSIRPRGEPKVSQALATPFRDLKCDVDIDRLVSTVELLLA